MNFKPLSGRVLIKQDDAEDKQGVLFIPDAAKERPLFGTVQAVANDVTNITVGEKVLFGMYSGTEISLLGEILLIMKQEEVMGIVS